MPVPWAASLPPPLPRWEPRDGTATEDRQELDARAGGEAALAVYIGLLCTNLRPREHFSSVGGNLGEEQEQGATLGIM